VSDWSGNRVPVQVDLVPQSYKLGLPFPNPFNNFTTLSYDLPADGVMSLIVYDITGREIQRLVDSGFQNAGNYSMVWKAEEVSSGLYFIRMESGDFNFTRKVVLLK
ncbi:MAG: T9SS type A sorting domain-containing protein, partial [FCB group bacterium]|nr:T9SS type A sorting domain-containing protein [FCB group bacterium]